MWWEWEDGEGAARPREEVPVDFDFISLVSKAKDYYKILKVDYHALEDANQKWHPDKKQCEENSTSRFQEINEAYQGYLNRHKGLILTCNGLGIRYSVW